MCELFAISSRKKVNLNNLLKEFFSHSIEHSCGWGMIDFDDDCPRIQKEAIKAIESDYLKGILGHAIVSSSLMAHIRKATVGTIEINNNHPFSKKDISGRMWILIHNGTIFESDVINRFQKYQIGTTDSERILLYIVDEMNSYIENHGVLSSKERFLVLDRMMQKITPGNKVNLILYDEENYYIHKNHEGTLFVKRNEDTAIFSTTPLDEDTWEAVPMNCLQMYKDGELLEQGTVHGNTYIYNEEHYKHLYMAYSNL